MWSSLLSGLRALLAPPRCPGCDRELPEPTLAARAPGAEPPGPELAFCAACALLLEPPPRSFVAPARCAAAHLYVGPLADAIRRFKYQGRTDHAPALAACLRPAAAHVAGEVVAVVPIPLHPARLRARGYNQAALLCHPLARALGVPLRTDLLRRVRPTETQAGLPRAARADNVRGAFSVRGQVPSGPVLLVDDVRTTGATLTSAALCLRRAGVPGVRMLVLAQADV